MVIVERGQKQEGWIRTKETTQQGVHLNGQALFAFLARLFFSLMSGCQIPCTVASLLILIRMHWHHGASNDCMDLLGFSTDCKLNAKLVIRSKSLSHFGPKALGKQVGPIYELGSIRLALSHKTCRHHDRVGNAVPIP